MSDAAMIKPGRWPIDLRVKLNLAIKEKVTLKLRNGNQFSATYLGPSQQSTEPMERFLAPDCMDLPINLPMVVYAGKHSVGNFYLATIRPDEETILLIKEENLRTSL